MERLKPPALPDGSRDALESPQANKPRGYSTPATSPTRSAVLSELAVSPARRTDGGQIEHPLIAQGNSSPDFQKLSAFNVQDCAGVIKDLDSIIRKPSVSNVDELKDPRALADEIVKQINGKAGTAAKRWLWGRMVHEGYIQFIQNGSRTEAVAAGRWNLLWRRANWAKMYHLNEKRIVHGNVTVVWIQRRELGLAWETGREVVLDAGLHVYNNPTFVLERTVDRSTEYVSHGTLHIVRVPKGKFAKVWVSATTGGLQPRVLAEGTHMLDCSLFSYEGLVAATDRHIQHGSLQLLRIPSSHIGKVNHDGQPQLLGPGFHFFESSYFQFVSLASLADKVITHGTITLIRVCEGEVAVAWLNHEPLLLDAPGSYGYDDRNFVYVRHQPVSDKVIGVGSRKVVTVHDGEVCVSYQHGALRILQPGRHILEDPSQTVGGFLPKEEAHRLTQGRTKVPLPLPLAGCGCLAPANSQQYFVAPSQNFAKPELQSNAYQTS
eukprot:TRINITY_DN14823_c0_g1_i1.p1 TRINITY_DN14823_c0_g1~~TRINITY_DN14823_c0_g1_i1.p1  ORF type:complete len:493 (+),score=80.53 TRINITY_DN14823_c0_g1_i1:32-1510(+)